MTEWKYSTDRNLVFHVTPAGPDPQLYRVNYSGGGDRAGGCPEEYDEVRQQRVGSAWLVIICMYSNHNGFPSRTQKSHAELSVHSFFLLPFTACRAIITTV